MTTILPFGDHAGDGLVQLSFTLPVASTPVGQQAARLLAEQMGLRNAEVVHEIALCKDVTHYTVYGKVDYKVDISRIEKQGSNHAVLTKDQVEAVVRDTIRRPVTVIGASTGSDTHSVGIDAILNHKGYGGNGGLEAYQGFSVLNLGSQVPNEVLIREAVRIGADAILVSQTVTQQNLHVANLTELVDMLEAEGLRDRFLLICGGARITSGLAKELGYDAAFSKGTFAQHVASFIVSKLQPPAAPDAVRACALALEPAL